MKLSFLPYFFTAISKIYKERSSQIFLDNLPSPTDASSNFAQILLDFFRSCMGASSLAATGECYCTRLFQLEESLAELTPEERYTQRLELEKPVLDALLAWANETLPKTAPKSALGKALHYLLEQWPYLVRYLEDGRLELSNNRAERSIKPFVMGRKNWLFANTPAGAQSSAVIYSLIETAKENQLDPYRYLLWVLRSAPVLSQADESWAEKLLPALAPQECYTPQK